jgi:hypothetical protein
MSTEEKTLQLVQRLYSKTKSGEMAWERTTGAGVYQVAFPNYTVKVSARGSDYVITILDESGSVLESVSDVDLAKASKDTKAAYQWMSDLYESRRQALGVDSALDSLLSELS